MGEFPLPSSTLFELEDEWEDSGSESSERSEASFGVCDGDSSSES